MPDSKALKPVKKKSCFVVCPIGDEGSATRRHADWLLHEIIEHVLEAHFTGNLRWCGQTRLTNLG